MFLFVVVDSDLFDLFGEVRVFPDGSIVVRKRDLGVSHIPGSLWSWAPDGNEAAGDEKVDMDIAWAGSQPIHYDPRLFNV